MPDRLANRRLFIRACAAAGSGLVAPLVRSAAPLKPRTYARARLTDADGAPLRATTLAPHRNFVFFYPFRSTPCFLLNLGRAAAPAEVDDRGQRYAWPGGIGRARAIVAFSAICPHQLTYPTREISFISFRSGKSGANRHGDVIHCCSEHSQFDPAAGARVVAGPAPAPLAAILLEHDPATDALHATGTLGTEMFNEFFRKYEFRLGMEFAGKARDATDPECRVTELERFCRQQVRC